MRLLLLPLMLVALVLTACSDGSDRPPPVPPPTITALHVEPPRAALDVGTTESFRAIAAYSDGSVSDVSPRAAWSLDVDNGTLQVLSDPAQSGQYLVEASMPGEETIRVRLEGRDGIAIVSVVDVPLTRIDIEPMSAELLEGTEFSFAATGHYEDGQSQDITDEGEWTSADPGVASVSGAGVVKAESEGATTISAALDGVTGNATIEVNPQVELDFIEVSPAEVRLFLEGSQQFNAIAHYTDGSLQVVTSDALWISSDTSVVAQDNFRKGLFLARQEGSAEITAEYGINNRGSASVTVERLVVTHILISPRDATLEMGETRRYFTEAVGSDGSLNSVNQSDEQFYEVADPAVAYISNDPANKGILTTLEPGTTTVTSTFTYEGEEFTAQGTLTVCAPGGC